MFFPLTEGIAQGTDYNQRIGKMIKCRQLILKMNFAINNQYFLVNNGAERGVTLRVLLVASTGGIAGARTAAGITQEIFRPIFPNCQPNVADQYDVTNHIYNRGASIRRFRILSDKKYRLTDIGKPHLHINRSRKMTIPVFWPDIQNNPDGYTTDKNQLYILIYCDTPTFVQLDPPNVYYPATCNVMARLYFTP